MPLVRPATITVVILSLIGGLRSFDLIWTMTGGGPGFASDTIASVIYKQYAGRATTGSPPRATSSSSSGHGARASAVPLLEPEVEGTMRATRIRNLVVGSSRSSSPASSSLCRSCSSCSRR